MTRDQWRTELERRIDYAKRTQSTAPVATVLEDVLSTLDQLDSGNGGSVEAKPDRMLSAKEAGPLLGMSSRWLYKNAESLPFSKKYPGGAVRFSKQGIERWLSRQR